MDWKNKLNIIHEELVKKEGGDTNVCSGSDSNSGSGSSAVSGVSLPQKTAKDIKTPIKDNVIRATGKLILTTVTQIGGTDMVTAEGALKDYEDILKEEGSDATKLLKVMKIVIKLLLNVRTNQMLPEAEKVRIFEEAKKRQAQNQQKKG
jgi:hypothetical protein